MEHGKCHVGIVFTQSNKVVLQEIGAMLPGGNLFKYKEDDRF